MGDGGTQTSELGTIGDGWLALACRWKGGESVTIKSLDLLAGGWPVAGGAVRFDK